jgi:hypothetical protein
MADVQRRPGDWVEKKPSGSGSSPTRDSDSNDEKKVREDGKIELTEDDCYQKLGFSYPTWKK